jgi:Ca2+:H+ antiporter
MNRAMTFLRRYGRFLLLGVRADRGRARVIDARKTTAIFCVSALAILPLAAMIGRSTEVLADRLGGGIGGLLNATFGNAAELIIGALALREGLFDLVKAIADGSIIGNVLLVFGASAFVGGLKHHDPALQPHRRRLGTTMLLLSTIGLVVPAVFPSAGARRAAGGVELKLDTEIAWCCSDLLCQPDFTLRTHRDLFGPVDGQRHDRAHEHERTSDVR